MSTSNNLTAIAAAFAAQAYIEGDHELVFDNGIKVRGEYYFRVNDGDWERSGNLVTTEGIAHILNVALGATAKPANYYIALFAAAATPAASWSAANFATVANEIVSMTEGYSEATRPKWTPTTTDNNNIDNFANPAKVTIKTATSLTVTGLALLTTPNRGGTTGILVSATKFGSARVFQDSDTFDIGYRLSLTV